MKPSKSVERLQRGDSPNFASSNSPATDVTSISHKTQNTWSKASLSTDTETLSYFKQRCEVLERDVSRLQSEKLKFERQVRQLQEANTIAAKVGECNGRTAITHRVLSHFLLNSNTPGMS